MTLRIVGAGLGRTGTHSLKVALEQLLGGRCYHMVEVVGRPDHIELWTRAFRGDLPDWHALFEGFDATVDWPSGGIWEPIADAYPDALILLSTRESAEQWYASAERTIFESMRRMRGEDHAFARMSVAMNERFGAAWDDEAGCKAAYERHNAHVRATVPTDRLIEWRPADGWGPLCAALGLPEPAEPFPLTNTTEDFRAQFGMDA